jgi:hypothetical protein
MTDFSDSTNPRSFPPRRVIHTQGKAAARLGRPAPNKVRPNPDQFIADQGLAFNGRKECFAIGACQPELEKLSFSL